MNQRISFFTILLLSLTLATGENLQAQEKSSGSIVMTSKGLSETKEIIDLFRFMKIEYYQITIKGSIKGKHYSLTSKEIWNGKIQKTDTIFNSASADFSFIGKHQKDSLNFSVMAAKAEKKKLKLNFSFDRVGLLREYKCTSSENYSLRDIGTQMTIKPGKPFYAFAYILPYEHPNGFSSWCEVESSGKDIEKWGTEFGIEHYILFEMNFFE